MDRLQWPSLAFGVVVGISSTVGCVALTDDDTLWRFCDLLTLKMFSSSWLTVVESGSLARAESLFVPFCETHVVRIAFWPMTEPMTNAGVAEPKNLSAARNWGCFCCSLRPLHNSFLSEHVATGDWLLYCSCSLSLHNRYNCSSQ